MAPTDGIRGRQRAPSAPPAFATTMIRCLLLASAAATARAQRGARNGTRRLQALDRSPSFYDVARKTNTDKIKGRANLAKRDFQYAGSQNDKCKVFGHFYDTIYDRWMPRADAPRFQFLEIGYFNGHGFDAFMEFLPNAEAHSLEVSCLPPGDGKVDGYWTEWPKAWGNFAETNPRYASLRAAKRLHCGDASWFDFLEATWTTHMRRPDAPPLAVVVDDGSHIASQMVDTVFFWFPRLAPRGVLVVEDIQPTDAANPFRAKFLPQMMHDLHFCGNPDTLREVERFPTLRPLLNSIHCELHVCVFERNDEPAVPDLSRELSTQPAHALDPAAYGGRRSRGRGGG